MSEFEDVFETELWEILDSTARLNLGQRTH